MREILKIRLSIDLLNKLKKDAKENGLSISAYVRFILINYGKI